MAYLDDHPPERRQFYCPRRDGTQPSGVVVVHDAENVTDVSGPDTGAEAVARFIQTRDTPGSYHDLVDSDSIVQLVRYECEAFHDATGTNRHSYGVSGAYRHSDWLTLPKAWRDNCVRNMAAAAAGYARWLKARRGITIPARRISVAAARNRVPGFISHAELDPSRRTDPGPFFPWTDFLAEFARLTNQENDDMTPEEHKLLVDTAAYAAATHNGVVNLRPTDSGAYFTFSRAQGADEGVKALRAEVAANQAALMSAISQLGAGGDIDYARVQDAAEAAVREVLGSIDEQPA